MEDLKVTITISGELAQQVIDRQKLQNAVNSPDQEYSSVEPISEWICSQDTLDLEYEIRNAILDQAKIPY